MNVKSRSCIFLLVLFVPLASCARPLSAIIDVIRPSVVAVGTYEPTDNPQAQFRGTGFAVGDGRHIVTNRHVLPNTLDSEHMEQIAVFIGRGKKIDMRFATLEAADASHDLALLKIDGPSLPTLQLADNSSVKEGNEIAFTGFPIGMVLGLYPVTHHGFISAITPIVIPAPTSDQLTARAIKAMSNPFDVLQLDATAYPGNSGSPVFDCSTGKVVGLVNMVFVKGVKESALSDPSGITYAIPAGYIEKLVQSSHD